tara:strand:- start:961 stop:1221 length:261 start_codon:yes stop_codon:yes gene_type:complete
MNVKSFALASVFVLVIGVFFAGCTDDCSEDECSADAGIANPAAVKCEADGYELVPTETDNGTITMCVSLEGGECEEWDYFRGECEL